MSLQILQRVLCHHVPNYFTGRGVFFKKNKGIGVQQLQKSLGAVLPNALSLWHWESPGMELPLICNDGGYDG